MLNEPMDDDEGTGTPVAPVAAKDPDGTFRRELAGRSILFRVPAPSQALIVRRTWLNAIKDLRKVRADVKSSDEDRYQRIMEVTTDFDLKMLTFIEGLIVDPADVDFLVEAQLLGTIGVGEMFSAVMSLGNPDAPDDDVAAPKPAVKKAAKKAAPNPIRKAATAKKAANARRTQK